MALLSCVVLIVVIGSAISFSGTFVPKSFYTVDKNGHKSDIVYLRTRRESNLNPLFRVRRSSSTGSATAYSSASASSSSFSGSGGGGGPVNYGNGYVPNFAEPDFGNFAFDFEPAHLPQGATIFSRFGEEDGSSVQAAGNAQGPQGAFSSTAVKSADGKVQYSVKSGKY